MGSGTAEQIHRMLRAVMLKKGTGEAGHPRLSGGGQDGYGTEGRPGDASLFPEYWASSFYGLCPGRQSPPAAVRRHRRAAEGHYGAEVAGPIFVKVMAAALPYLGVPPRQSQPGHVAEPSRTDADAPSEPPPAQRRHEARPPPPGPPAWPRFLASPAWGWDRPSTLARRAGLRSRSAAAGWLVRSPHRSARRSPVCQLRLAPSP